MVIYYLQRNLSKENCEVNTILGIKISQICYGTPLSAKYPRLIKTICSKIGKQWSAIYLYYFGYGGYFLLYILAVIENYFNRDCCPKFAAGLHSMLRLDLIKK
jgi:hypothetical protein